MPFWTRGAISVHGVCETRDHPRVCRKSGRVVELVGIGLPALVVARHDCRYRRGDPDGVVVALAAYGPTRCVLRGSVAGWICVVRTLLRLRVARRAARVWLFWRHHRQPARSQDSIEKPGAPRAGVAGLVRLSQNAEGVNHWRVLNSGVVSAR